MNLQRYRDARILRRAKKNELMVTPSRTKTNETGAIKYELVKTGVFPHLKDNKAPMPYISVNLADMQYSDKKKEIIIPEGFLLTYGYYARV